MTTPYTTSTHPRRPYEESSAKPLPGVPTELEAPKRYDSYGHPIHAPSAASTGATGT
ncbi:hypothetical protein HK102_002855, partial [Quaeritorhiza haematococci]